VDPVSRHAHGLRAWLLQRISAVYLAVFLVYLVIHFIRFPSLDFEEWRGWLGGRAVGLASAGFIVALVIHAWVGMRDVLLDYLPHSGLRLAGLTLVAFMLAACGVWALSILLMTGMQGGS
jgi:succinate dehydrogenase / fumarate reductase membrane anchor subunit